MRLLVDAQAIQTISRDRGIGRYSLSLLRAMVDAPRGHEVHAVINAQHSADDAVGARLALTEFMAPERVHAFQFDVPTQEGAGDQFRLAAQASYCATIATVDPDLVLVTSPFEDDRLTVLTVNHHEELPPMVGILYDLIPAMSPEVYTPDDGYWRRFREVSRFDALLAISEYSASQAREAYGPLCPPVTPIWGGPFAADFPNSLPRATPARPFVLYVGGDHPRKNLSGAIGAWARVSSAIRETHSLVIACNLSPNSLAAMQDLRDELGMGEADVIFTGRVSDAELAHLYGTARLFIFPSLEEGLGMPPLEAMSQGCPSLVANNSSLVELVLRDEALFDGSSPESIAKAVDRALSSPDLLSLLREDAELLSERFTWTRSAERAWEVMEGLVNRRDVGAERSLGRIGVLSPLPPTPSGVADYTARLAPALRAVSCDVVLRDDTLAGVGSIDARILHLGNSSWHVPIVKEGRRQGGYVFVHDTHLGLTYQHLLEQGLDDEELSESLTDQDNLSVPARVPPGLRWSLEKVDGAFFHSRHAARLSFEAGCVNVPTAVVPFPGRRVSADRSSARALLGIGGEELVVAHFGIVSSAKGVLQLVAALKECGNALGPTVLALVGYAPDAEYLGRVQNAAQNAGLSVRVAANASSDRWDQWMQATDIAVQLRTVDHGESSAAVAELLATGVPLVVSDHGAARELDDSVALRVPHPLLVEDVAAAILSLNDPAVREAMSIAQVRYVEENRTERRWAETVAGHISKWQTLAPFRAQMRQLVDGDLHQWPPPISALERPFFGWICMSKIGLDASMVRSLLDEAGCALYLPDCLESWEVGGADLVIVDDSSAQENTQTLLLALALGRAVVQVGVGPIEEALHDNPGFRFLVGDLRDRSSWQDLLELYATPTSDKDAS